MRRSFTVLAPIAVGAVVLALAAAYPASQVHGSALTGPAIPKSIANVQASDDYRAHWAPRSPVILLQVRDGARCEPRLERRASTGPARLEVQVDRPTGPACAEGRRWWSLRLAPPPIRSRTQIVSLYVDGRWTPVASRRR